MTRQLTIEIDSAGLTALTAAGQQVTLVKSGTGVDFPVAWQVIAPVGRITVSWDTSYQVYAATTPIAAGNRLQVESSAPATAGCLYPFTGGQFGPGTASLGAAEIGIQNADRAITMHGVAMLTGGLTQLASVNDNPASHPLTAQAILFGQHGVSAINERVLVLPTGGISPGTLLSQRWLTAAASVSAGVTLGQPLLVDLTTVTDQTIHYDDQENRFVAGTGQRSPPAGSG